MKKVLISMVSFLSLIIFLTIATSAVGQPSDWATEEVTMAIEAGLVPDEMQTEYQQPVSREAVAKMFVNLLEKATGTTVDEIMAERGVAPDSNAFTDTDDSAVLMANALGILNGVGQNRFDPEGNLKRAQIAAVINRIALIVGIDTSGYTHSFSDVVGNYSWADGELGWPAAYGIVKGVGPNKFSPDGDLTTEQAIAIVYRALSVLREYREMSTHVDPPQIISFQSLESYLDFVSASELSDEEFEKFLDDAETKRTDPETGETIRQVFYRMNGVQSKEDAVRISEEIGSIPFPKSENFKVTYMDYYVEAGSLWILFKDDSGRDISFRTNTRPTVSPEESMVSLITEQETIEIEIPTHSEITKIVRSLSYSEDKELYAYFAIIGNNYFRILTRSVLPEEFVEVLSTFSFEELGEK